MRYNFKINVLSLDALPNQLKEIPQPPKKMYGIGDIPIAEHYLCVVGSRKFTDYGKEVCEMLIDSLKGTNTVIVSGLALGIDSIAHRAALRAGLKTIAVPGSGLSAKALSPQQHMDLACDIIDAGGCLISEFEPDQTGAPWTFPQRNRIMAGMSQTVLIIEANEKSGTLITARFGLDYNRNVLVVPGPITSATSLGTNRLLRQGAEPITCVDDLHEALGFKVEKQPSLFANYENCSSDELKLIEVLQRGKRTKDVLIRESIISTTSANIALSILEMKGLIEEKLGEIRLV